MKVVCQSSKHVNCPELQFKSHKSNSLLFLISLRRTVASPIGRVYIAVLSCDSVFRYVLVIPNYSLAICTIQKYLSFDPSQKTYLFSLYQCLFKVWKQTTHVILHCVCTYGVCHKIVLKERAGHT